MTPRHRPLPGPRKPYNGPGAAGSFTPDTTGDDEFLDDITATPSVAAVTVRKLRPKPRRHSARLRIELDVIDVPCDPKVFVQHVLAPSKRNLRNVEITDA